MKIYVASHDRWEACSAASVLSNAGHIITSRWHGKEFLQTNEHTVEERIAIAKEDYEDVAAADALVLIAGPDRYPGGKFVETGIALGMGKRVVVIGRRENMLIWLPDIQQVDDPQGAADLLSAALSVPAAAVVGEPAIEHAEWLEACATNEPSQSDAEKLWTCAQLIRTLASRISQQDAELERLRRELAELKSDELGFGNSIGAGAISHLRDMYRSAYDALGSSGRTSLRNFVNARVDRELAEARKAAFIEAAEIAEKQAPKAVRVFHEESHITPPVLKAAFEILATALRSKAEETRT